MNDQLAPFTIVAPLGLLNTTIVTADGSYELSTLTQDEAEAIVRDHVACGVGVDSAIGHEATAEAMTALLPVPGGVPVNRQQFAQSIGQDALCFKLRGRIPEGTVLTRAQLDELGYEWKLLRRFA